MKNLIAATLVAAACGGALAQNHAPVPAPHKPVVLCASCGIVQQVHQEKRKGKGGAAGIIGGAVVGGLLGHQIGGGTGNTLATVGGAAAGGYAGNEVQKRVNSKIVWVTKVRMRDGSIRTFEQAARPGWSTGQAVRVHENNTLSRM